MADQIISLTIPDAKVQIALQGFLKIYPNVETIPNPEYVPPTIDDGGGNQIPNPAYVGEPETLPKYTTAQWVTEKQRRLFIRDVRRGLQMIATDAAQVAEDDDLVTG